MVASIEEMRKQVEAEARDFDRELEKTLALQQQAREHGRLAQQLYRLHRQREALRGGRPARGGAADTGGGEREEASDSCVTAEGRRHVRQALLPTAAAKVTARQPETAGGEQDGAQWLESSPGGRDAIESAHELAPPRASARPPAPAALAPPPAAAKSLLLLPAFSSWRRLRAAALRKASVAEGHASWRLRRRAWTALVAGCEASVLERAAAEHEARLREAENAVARADASHRSRLLGRCFRTWLTWQVCAAQRSTARVCHCPCAPPQCVSCRHRLTALCAPPPPRQATQCRMRAVQAEHEARQRRMSKLLSTLTVAPAVTPDDEPAEESAEDDVRTFREVSSPAAQPRSPAARVSAPCSPSPPPTPPTPQPPRSVREAMQPAAAAAAWHAPPSPPHVSTSREIEEPARPPARFDAWVAPPTRTAEPPGCLDSSTQGAAALDAREAPPPDRPVRRPHLFTHWLGEGTRRRRALPTPQVLDRKRATELAAKAMLGLGWRSYSPRRSYSSRGPTALSAALNAPPTHPAQSPADADPRLHQDPRPEGAAEEDDAAADDAAADDAAADDAAALSGEVEGALADQLREALSHCLDAPPAAAAATAAAAEEAAAATAAPPLEPSPPPPPPLALPLAPTQSAAACAEAEVDEVGEVGEVGEVVLVTPRLSAPPVGGADLGLDSSPSLGRYREGTGKVQGRYSLDSSPSLSEQEVTPPPVPPGLPTARDAALPGSPGPPGPPGPAACRADSGDGAALGDEHASAAAAPPAHSHLNPLGDRLQRRADERRLRREELQTRYREAQAATAAAAEAAAEEEASRLAHERRERAARTRAAREAAEARRRRAAYEQAKMGLAALHCERKLLASHGWAPWRALLARARGNVERARAHRRAALARPVLAALTSLAARRRAAESCDDAVRGIRAQRLARRATLRAGLVSLRRGAARHQQGVSAARRAIGIGLSRRVWAGWMREVTSRTLSASPLVSPLHLPLHLPQHLHLHLPSTSPAPPQRLPSASHAGAARARARGARRAQTREQGGCALVRARAAVRGARLAPGRGAAGLRARDAELQRPAVAEGERVARGGGGRYREGTGKVQGRYREGERVARGGGGGAGGGLRVSRVRCAGEDV